MGWSGYIHGNARCVALASLTRKTHPIISDVAQEREIEGDLVLGDIGYGMPFRAGSFDGAIR